MKKLPEGLRLELRRQDLMVGWRLHFRLFNEQEQVIGHGAMVRKPGWMTPQMWEAHPGPWGDARWEPSLIPIIEDEAFRRREEWM